MYEAIRDLLEKLEAEEGDRIYILKVPSGWVATDGINLIDVEGDIGVPLGVDVLIVCDRVAILLSSDQPVKEEEI